MRTLIHWPQFYHPARWTHLPYILADLANNREGSPECLGRFASSALGPVMEALVPLQRGLACMARRWRSDPHKQCSRDK